MTTKSKSPWTEEDIPQSYNEFDSDEDQSIPLRTIVEFELFDKSSGELVCFDDLSDTSRHISLRGFVVEPLPLNWRETVNSLLSTTPSEQLDLNIAASASKKKKPVLEDESSPSEINEEVVADDTPQELASLDWEALKVGDNVDGYCNKTFKWYEAKVVQVDNVKCRYKVHFQGWNSKYDEWIEKFSQRLVAFQTSRKIMQEAVKNAARMVPWYQYSLLMKRAQEVMNQKFPSRQPAYVTIDKVDDWCVDYTYANPTLWLISGENWYRVAGAFCPGGCFGSPTDEYRRYFFVALEKYLCAAHVSMILLDQLPTNPSVTLQAVIEEVVKRSVGMVNEVNCLQHYQFLIDQLSSIELPSEWDPKVTIVKSLFMSQLRREGEAFVTGGGMTALLTMTYKGQHVKRRTTTAQQYAALLVDLNQGGINSSHVAVMHLAAINDNEDAPKSGRKSRKSKTSAEHNDDESDEQLILSLNRPAASKKKVKVEFPMEDSELWSYEFKTNKKSCPPIPEPTKSDQLIDMQVNDPKMSFHYQNLLLMVMTTLTNFRNTLKLPVFHLRDLELAISTSQSSVHPLLRQMCIAMLMVIIRAYVQGGLIKTVYVDGRRVTSDLDDDEIDCREPLIIEAAKSEESLLKFLQVGDTWIEITKLICEKVDFAEFAVAIGGFIHPIRSCQEIFSEMVQQFSTLPFSHPIDSDLHGLPDYFDIIEEPMDFGTIKLRLAAGWYEPEDSYSFPTFQDDQSTTACQPDDSHFDATIVKLKRPSDPYFQIGQFVDFYDTTLQKWIEGIVENREYSASTDNISVTSQEPKVLAYWIRRVGFAFPPCVSIRVSVDEDRVIQHRAASSERLRRVMSPSEFFAKFPQHAPLNDEDWVVQQLGTVQRTQHASHAGFAEDMRLVWKNCVKYYKHFDDNYEENEFVQEAQKMEAFFEREYARRVQRFVGKNHADAVAAAISETYQQQYYRPFECWKLALKALASTESREVVHAAVPQVSVSEDLEMLHLLTDMKKTSFLNLPVAEKVVFLHWLCYSFLDTDFVHNELNSTAQAPKQLVPLKQLANQRDSTMSASQATVEAGQEAGAMDIDEVLAEEESSTLKKTPAKGSTAATNASTKKRGRDSELADAATEESGTAANTTTSASAKKKPRLSEKSSVPTTDSNTADNAAATAEKARKWGAKRGTDTLMLHRHDCLGMDRFSNRYWVFSDHCTHIPTLFCEMRFQVGVATIEYSIDQPKGPRWLLFSDAHDLVRLLAWLDERGNNEALLLRAIYEWIKENGIVLPKVEDGVTSATTDPSAEEKKEDVHNGDAHGTSAAKSGAEQRRRKTEERLCYELISQWKKNDYGQENAEPYRAQELSLADIQLRTHRFMPLTEQSTRFFILQVTFSVAAKQLGMGVKAAADGAVYVTSFSSAESITKKAGFCVGDRIIFAGGKLRPNVLNLVEMVKKAGQEVEKAQGNYNFPFIVRRLKDARMDPMFRGIYEKDREIVKQFQQELSDEAAAFKTVETQFAADPHHTSSVHTLHSFPCKMQEQPGYFNDVLTMFLEVWLKLAHPAFTTQYFRVVLLEGWLTKILEVVTDVEGGAGEEEVARIRGELLCQYATKALLDLEWDLYRVGSVLRDDWLGSQLGNEGNFAAQSVVGGVAGSASAAAAAAASSSATTSSSSAAAATAVPIGPVAFVPGRIATRCCHSRRRQEWRDFCRHAVVNVETWSYAIATFMYHAVDWELFQRQLIPVAATRIPHVLQQVGMEEDFVAHLLKEGNRLMYFGDGHAEAVQADRDLYAASHHQYFHVLADQYFRRPFAGSNKVQSAGVGRLLPYRRSTVLWGDSLPPQVGSVMLCQIAKAQIFHTTIPFVQLTLNVLATLTSNNQSIPSPTPVLPFPNPRVLLSRHLQRILVLIKRYNNCKPFLTPVSAEEYPSYCEVITNPIDLSIIEKKINNLQYSQYTQFLEDMQLLAQNCVDFCGADSKKYPPMARALLRDAERLCRKHFDASYVEGTDALENALEDDIDRGKGRLGEDEDENEDEDNNAKSAMDVDHSDDDNNNKNTTSNSSNGAVLVSPMRRSGRLSSSSATDLPELAASSVVAEEKDKDDSTSNSANMNNSSNNQTNAGGGNCASAQLKTMTISVRLDRLWPTFLVEPETYTRCLKRWNAGVITAQRSSVRVEIAPDRQGNPRYATGVIIGNKEPIRVTNRLPTTAKVMPWEFIQVEWNDQADAALLPSFVNCWDVDVIPDK